MGYRINIRNAKYAPVQTDTAASYTLGTAVNLPGLQTLDLTLTSASGELYGDGAMVAKDTKLTGAQVKVNLAKIDIAARAALTGATVDSKGILITSTDDQAPKIAFYAETEENDGKKEQLWFLCGKAEPIGASAAQSTNSITYSTDELTINFIRREKDNALYKWLDTADSTVTAQTSTDFESDPD